MILGDQLFNYLDYATKFDFDSLFFELVSLWIGVKQAVFYSRIIIIIIIIVVVVVVNYIFTKVYLSLFFMAIKYLLQVWVICFYQVIIRILLLLILLLLLLFIYLLLKIIFKYFFHGNQVSSASLDHMLQSGYHLDFVIVDIIIIIIIIIIN